MAFMRLVVVVVVEAVFALTLLLLLLLLLLFVTAELVATEVDVVLAATSGWGAGLTARSSRSCGHRAVTGKQ